MSDERKREPWVMPTWMEPYRDLFQNTGGDSVENLMNDRSSNYWNNVVRAALCIAVDSQVTLLHRLHNRGMLNATDRSTEHVPPARLGVRSEEGDTNV